jgi:ditrans,polycis-polyprenyl diphosphate synthase
VNVQAAARKAEELTRHNSRWVHCAHLFALLTHFYARAILNLCMPYTAWDEITSAVQAAVRKNIENGPDSEYLITEKEIESQLFTTVGGSPPLDILIRTSGVNRLSDFLLWQCCENTQLQFTSTYWPDFGLWDFVPIIFDYQRKVWSE